MREETINIDWFKRNILPVLTEYKVIYRFFENGDFGDVERVEFEGNGKGGTIDFWNSHWLSIHMYDYSEQNEIINILLEPNENIQKIKSFERLKELIKIN